MCGKLGGGRDAGLGPRFCCVDPILKKDKSCIIDTPKAPCVICELFKKQ